MNAPGKSNPLHAAIPNDSGMEYEILLLQIGSLTRKKYAAEETVREHESKVDAVLARVEKKTGNLDRLQKDSFSNTVMKVFGTYESIVHREAEDILRAKVDFDKAYALKVASQRAILDLDQEIEEKKHRLHIVKEQLVRKNPSLENLVSEREQRLIQLQYEFVQTVEAEEAAYHLLESIRDLLQLVENTEVLRHMNKLHEMEVLLDFMRRDQLDAAEARLLDLERKIHQFHRELKDLNYIYENQYEAVVSAPPAIEAFLSEFFSSWSLKETVEKNLQQLHTLQDTVVEVMTILIDRKNDLEIEYIQSSQTPLD